MVCLLSHILSISSISGFLLRSLPIDGISSNRRFNNTRRSQGGLNLVFPMSSSSSLISLSPILLYAVASTLPITLIFLPIFLAPRLLNATRPDRGGGGDRSLSRSISVGLGLASTVSLVLYGICGLVSIGNGSLSAGIAAGILGALGLISSEFVHFERNQLYFRDTET